MFGYILTNCKTLKDEQMARFRSFYCGMCRSLKVRYGQISRFTLSYDMTFLALVLSALYECDEVQGEETCAAHPFKKHAYLQNEMIDYAVDMNILLAYHKCVDNVNDDKSLIAAAESKLLEKAYRKASESHREQSAVIENWMRRNAEIEARNEQCIDVGMNLTGEMLGKLFCVREDFFTDELYRMGENLGRFIYLMDAYDDLDKDIRKHRYNALKAYREQADFEDFCKASLTMMIAESTDAFETLPVLRDADLIRNILYSGVWARYGYIQEKKAKKAGLKEQSNAGSL